MVQAPVPELLHVAQDEHSAVSFAGIYLVDGLVEEDWLRHVLEEEVLVWVEKQEFEFLDLHHAVEDVSDVEFPLYERFRLQK